MDIERLTKAVEQEYCRLKEVKKREADGEVKVRKLAGFCVSRSGIIFEDLHVFIPAGELNCHIYSELHTVHRFAAFPRLKTENVSD